MSLLTVEYERMNVHMERLLNLYQKAPKEQIIRFSIIGGECLGFLHACSQMAGFPDGKLQEYGNRIKGIGEAHRLHVAMIRDARDEKPQPPKP